MAQPACLLARQRSRRRCITARGELIEDRDGGLMDHPMVVAPLGLGGRLLSLLERCRRRLVLKAGVAPVCRYIEAAGDVHSGPADDVVEREAEAGHVAVAASGAKPGGECHTGQQPDRCRPFRGDLR